MGTVDQGLAGQIRETVQRGMHLFGRSLENPPATTRKQSVSDQRDLGTAIGDVAGGMARDVYNLEVESEVWKGNEITAFDRVVDRRYVLSSGTEDRDLPRTEKLVHAADVITVVVGEEDCAEIQLPFLENLEHGLGLSGIHNHRCWRRWVGDEPNIIIGKSGHGFKKGHETMLPGNGRNSQSPEDRKRRFCFAMAECCYEDALPIGC